MNCSKVRNTAARSQWQTKVCWTRGIAGLYCELQHKCQLLFGLSISKMQRQWRIAPDKWWFCIEKWATNLQFEVMCDANLGGAVFVAGSSEFNCGFSAFYGETCWFWLDFGLILAWFWPDSGLILGCLTYPRLFRSNFLFIFTNTFDERVGFLQGTRHARPAVLCIWQGRVASSKFKKPIMFSTQSIICSTKSIIFSTKSVSFTTWSHHHLYPGGAGGVVAQNQACQMAIDTHVCVCVCVCVCVFSCLLKVRLCENRCSSCHMLRNTAEGAGGAMALLGDRLYSNRWIL